MTTLTAERSFNSSPKRDNIDINSFSELVGFPVDFLKEELLLDKEKVSIEELRSSILSYLDNTIQE